MQDEMTEQGWDVSEPEMVTGSPEIGAVETASERGCGMLSWSR